MNEKDSFRQELKELLEKYNVSIGFSVSECSDTYGLYDEKIIIRHNNEKWIEVDGWVIDGSDL